jgi:carboxyl-terminal processing protease
LAETFPDAQLIIQYRFTDHPMRGILGALCILGGATACASASSQNEIAVAAPAVSSPAAEPVETAIAVATFDSLWNKVNDTYVDTAFVASRWAMVRDSLRPRAARVSTRRELDKLLADALAYIPDSHFYIIPAAKAVIEESASGSDGRGSTGLSVRASNERIVAWKVEPGSPAATAGVTPGQLITRIGKRDTDSVMRRVSSLPAPARPRALSEALHNFNSALSPDVGDTVKIQVDEKPASKLIVAVPATGRVSQFGNLPPLAATVTSSRVPVATGNGCVGVIAFNIWLPELSSDLEEAVDGVRSCRGVVIDLRGNPGGVGAMVMGFGGYFVNSQTSLGTMRSRIVSLNFVINPRASRANGSRVEPYTGPLAILVDPMTASTSEIFATGMQRIGRARVFGQTSAGEALPALMERLPSGDVFVHAVADFTDPTGKRVEGAGAVPDEMVPLLVSDLKAGKDAPLDAAVRWITSESSGSK